MALATASTSWAGDGLETKGARKAAIACQKAIVTTRTKAAKVRTDALEQCVGRAFDCIQANATPHAFRRPPTSARGS